MITEELRRRSGDMLDVLATLVTAESPSDDTDALATCATLLTDIGTSLLGTPPALVRVDDRTHLRWQFGARPEVLLLGHYDTVWPTGTIRRWGFKVADGVATGPGIFDMKAGIVQGLFALLTLEDLDGVAVLLTADEELGSPTSRPIIEATAREARAVFVLEPSVDGALKTARHGVSLYAVSIAGLAAHAGLEPEKGVNALEELAHQVLAIARIARPEVGTSVTPTVAEAGTATNVVPAEATVHVDARVPTIAEQERVDREMRALAPVLSGSSIIVAGGPNRPPLEPVASEELYRRARKLADLIGIAPPDGRAVGGGSDGNFTAALGVPTLDGLGAVGQGAHAEGERVVVDAMPERAALVAALVADVLGRETS